MGIAFEEDGPCAVINFDSPDGARAFIAAYPAVCEDFEYVKGSMDDVFLPSPAGGREEKRYDGK